MASVTPRPQRQLTYRPRQGGKILEMAEAIAVRSGLPVQTCAELLRSRWTYMEFIDQPDRWVSPLAQLEAGR